MLGNVIYANGDGLNIANWATTITMVHNTIYGNTGEGITTRNTNTLVLQNNVITHNGGFGVDADDGDFSARDHNDFFANGSGWCSGCVSPGTGSLADDPMYIDAPSGDLRLQSASTLINAGVDLGHDVNGAGADDFNGVSPDIGAHETAE